MEDWIRLLFSRFRGRMARDEYTVRVCPYCGNERWNFEVNVEKLVFSCWVCGVGGTVRSLFYEFGLPVDGLPARHYGLKLQLEDEDVKVELPEGCRPVIHPEKPDVSNWALQYLTKNRGLTVDEIVRYQIQYTMIGDYAGRIVWPIYENDELVYFASRAFMNNIWPVYKFPEFRRRGITCIYTGIEHRMTLVLVEGVLQIPNIHRLGYSVMPLLGKQLTSEQAQKLVLRHFDRAVVLLDEDSVESGIRMARRLTIEGLRASWARTGGPDSDEITDEELARVLEEAKPASASSLVMEGIRRRRVLESKVYRQSLAQTS